MRSPDLMFVMDAHPSHRLALFASLHCLRSRVLSTINVNVVKITNNDAVRLWWTREARSKKTRITELAAP